MTDLRTVTLMKGLGEDTIDNIDSIVEAAEKSAVEMGCGRPGQAYALVWERMERLFHLMDGGNIDVQHLIQVRTGTALVAYHLRMSNRMEDALAKGENPEEVLKLEFNRWLFVVDALAGFAVDSSFNVFNKRKG